MGVEPSRGVVGIDSLPDTLILFAIGVCDSLGRLLFLLFGVLISNGVFKNAGGIGAGISPNISTDSVSSSTSVSRWTGLMSRLKNEL